MVILLEPKPPKPISNKDLKELKRDMKNKLGKDDYKMFLSWCELRLVVTGRRKKNEA